MVDTSESRGLRLIYYCSGHGYGHATRVSAFACHLLRLSARPTIHIVSSAPQHVFADSVALGAKYRNANIDPVIVQPVAYRVDREKSRQVLKDFLDEKPGKLEEEVRWLQRIKADCVLSDAAFLGCAAANAAGIPSVLITNFSFDSVYSYLSTPFVDRTDSFDLLQTSTERPLLSPDVPIPLEELHPLVEQLRWGYRCADLLLRLPGDIPIPSFSIRPDLPSQDWVDRDTRAFTPEVITHLSEPPSDYTLWPQVPFPPQYPPKRVPRTVLSAPLLVRSPDPAVYTQEGRSRLLSSLGIPTHRHDPATTKILIVSFGGQVFHKPHSHSRSPSVSSTPNLAILAPSKAINGVVHHSGGNPDRKRKLASDAESADSVVDALSDALRTNLVSSLTQSSPRIIQDRTRAPKLMIPGAPPASIPSSPLATNIPLFNTIPPTPKVDSTHVFPNIDEVATTCEDIGRLLPDDSWIAIVCGVSKEWAMEDGEELPDSFYVAPKYVYMPDLTAVSDVLLGKLGYGTVSECVDASTPFVYVSRPLFIEEHGLRLLLENAGVGVELSRESYEAGDWAHAVEEAYNRGKEVKAHKRREGETGKRAAEGREMATALIDWINRWKSQGIPN